MQTINIENLADLGKFAVDFAASLKGGEVIGLVGDLGAGKTTFVQRLAKAFGVKDAVKSPTFILMQIKPTSGAARKKGIARICHVDAYRLKDGAELFGIGFEEYAGKADTVTLVEWADRVPAIHTMPSYKEIVFEFGAASQERSLRLE